MRITMIFAAAAACLVATPAMAQTVTNNQGQYGDVQAVSGGYQLTSDPAGDGYGGIYFGLTDFTLGDLTSLSATYTVDQGTLAGGAPRFTLLGAGGSAYVYFTDPNTTSVTGTTTVECNGFGGCAYNYPGIAFTDFVSQYGSTALNYVTLDVDAGYTSTQQLTVSNFALNGTSFGATNTPAVPEPATWAMMLMGFGAVGFQMRRKRTSTLLQAA